MNDGQKGKSVYLGEGQNYENQNVENQKELRKPCKPSQRWKELLNYENHNVEKNIESHKNHFWRCDHSQRHR